MAHDDKPTSIWKKEISFRRKPGEQPTDDGTGQSGSIWKKEISLRKRDAEHQPEAVEETAAADPVLDAAIAALGAPAQPEPVAARPEPVAPPAPPAPAVEHDWLTQPLEEVSEPPAELAAVEPVAVEPAAPVIPIAPDPEPELELDLPTAVLPDLLPEAAWPVEPVAEPVAEAALVPEPEPVLAFELAPDPNPGSEPEPEPDVPFYKKQLSLSLKPRAPKAPKQPKEPKAKREKKEKPAREASEKVPFYKRELSFRRAPKEPAAAEAVTEVTPPGEAPAKVPFYKRDLSLKRSAKEWDPGEAVTEETPARPKLRRPPRPRPSLPSISRGGGGGGKQLVGLKIGGSQIAAARIRNGESPELLQAARMPLEHGVVVNGELRDPEALALALKGFFAQHKLPKRGVRLGIANNRIGVRTFEVTGIDDQKQLANAIRFRAQEVLPIPLEEAVLDYQVLSEGTTEDGQPVRRVLLVVAYRELVDRYVYACRKAGLQIVGIDLEAFALLRAVAKPLDASVEIERGALVAVSVGHDRSTFAVSDGRVCEFTRVLEWGGWALNVAIARALDMSPGEVEPLKRALSFTTTEHVPDGFDEEQLATAREVSRRQLQTFARELVSSLQFYQNQPGSLGIGEIALTGGSAHLPGLGEELSRLIGVPVTVVDPLHRLKVSKKVREPEQVGSLAVAIGLGIED